MTEIAIFGGGCFWCTEAVFKMLKGVISVTPGYAGGLTPNPTYEEVSTGKTGHAEVTRVEYDPGKISYRDLLTVFFATHDPTTVNRQGNDVGAQYRSIILYANEAQKTEAKEFIRELEASHPGGAPVVTEVKPLEKFYEAENYHRDYFEKNPDKAYCQLVINPKIEKVQQKFAELLKKTDNLYFLTMTEIKEIPKNEDEWRKRLTPEQYEVMREKGTEAPFSGRYVHEKKSGTYKCAACGQPLFSSGTKFDSGTGWPSFDQALPGAVKYEDDISHGMRRTEVLCARCGSHLGHVFNDGPTDPSIGSGQATGQRHCINSVCLKLDGA